jgi:transketolase
VAIEVYEKLKAQNLSVEVINASSIKPFDKDVLLKTAKKNGKIVTLEDHSVIGGLGSLVSEYLSCESPVQVHSFGVNDEFSQSGSIDELYAYYGLTSDEIVKKKFIIKITFTYQPSKFICIFFDPSIYFTSVALYNFVLIR